MEAHELKELTLRNNLKELKNSDRIVSLAASFAALKLSLSSANAEISKPTTAIHTELVGKCSAIGWTKLSTSVICDLYPADFVNIGGVIHEEVTETTTAAEVMLFITKLVSYIEEMNGV